MNHSTQIHTVADLVYSTQAVHSHSLAHPSTRIRTDGDQEPLALAPQAVHHRSALVSLAVFSEVIVEVAQAQHSQNYSLSWKDYYSTPVAKVISEEEQEQEQER